MKIVALAGGVGGAKLVDGLAQLLSREEFTVIVNTGDDFEHFGLRICPDLDTICYTLAGLANPDTGWGRTDDTFLVLENIQKLGGPEWFHIGDQDFSTHIERSRRLRSGQLLSQITRDFCEAWGVKHKVIPMSDQSVRTLVNSVDSGELSFQEYFVHLACLPKVKSFRFLGIESSQPAPGILDSIELADAVVICPSNPWVSIDPIMAIPHIRASLKDKLVVAVSPIIAGRAVKGPAAKMYKELGIRPSAVSVANHYNDLLSGFILDDEDADLAQEIKIPTKVTNTLMKSQKDRRRLAQDVLNFIQTLY